MSCTCLQLAYNVRSPCDCHVIVRRPYLHVLLTYGVLTHSHVVSAWKCDEREFFRPMSGGGGIYRTTFRGSPEVPFIYTAEISAHNVRCKCGARAYSVRSTSVLRAHWTVELGKCRVSTDHALITCAARTC